MQFAARYKTVYWDILMGEAAAGTILKIRLPDDFHHHCRDGEQTAAVLSHAARRFGRCLMMPNLKPPVTNADAADIYKQHILRSLPANSTMEPLMTLFLTDNTSPEDIRVAAAAGVVGCKYYPAGATTNSESGVTNIQKCYPALAAMVEQNLMLCIHSEVTHADIFEREPVFIEEIMKPLVRDFPRLKITMEHISTKEAVDYVLSAPDTVKATIACHHLLYNRNDLLVGGIRPHLYCLPILKAEIHRVALVEAATSGNPKFFLGTDSAPHAVDAKETSCGCAGVYTAHAAVELYTEVFDRVGKLDKLEDFCSSFGADHYGLPRSTKTIQLEKKSWKPPLTYDFGNGKTLRPLRAEEDVRWTITKDALSA
jgi:dihydroorotase